jgi:hypothetical protein
MHEISQEYWWHTIQDWNVRALNTSTFENMAHYDHSLWLHWNLSEWAQLKGTIIGSLILKLTTCPLPWRCTLMLMPLKLLLTVTEWLWYLLVQTKPQDKMFTELIVGHPFWSKPLVIGECFNFYKRSQESSETVAEFQADLCKLSMRCKFGTFRGRSCFVCGVRSESKLLAEDGQLPGL